MGISPYNYHPYKALAMNEEGFLYPIFKKEYNKRSQAYITYYMQVMVLLLA